MTEPQISPQFNLHDRVEATVRHGGGYHDPNESIYSGGTQETMQGTVLEVNEFFAIIQWDQIPAHNYFVNHDMLDGRDGFPVRDLHLINSNTTGLTLKHQTEGEQPK